MTSQGARETTDRRRRGSRLAGLCLMGVLLIVIGLGIYIVRLPVPTYDEVLSAYRSSYITLLDRDGAVLERVRSDYDDRRDNWTQLVDISPALTSAVLQSEDRRFYSHPGVDVLALGGAVRDRLTRNSMRGSSTLTMQLAGMLHTSDGRAGRRTLVQKMQQMVRALAMELHWSKSQILEAYLNLVPWRGELSGITATARSLFGKYPAGLDNRESAILAAMLRAPNASPAVISRRACGILQAQSQAQYCDHLAGIVQYHLNHTTSVLQDDPFSASHFARRRLALDMPQQERLNTTIDGALQRNAQAIVNRVVHEIRHSHANDAAAVVLDNRTGSILAYVGSSGELATARYVDNAAAMRQAGSTLKPFLYVQALEQRRITAASLLDDSAVNLPTGNGLYVPQNYDKQFGGWVSARTALASSLNIPAVRLLVMVTPDVFHQRLRQLGLPLQESGDYYGYSLALGSADVTLLSLTNAYRALANGGMYSDVNWGVGAAPPASRIMSEEAAWLVGDILSDRQARARTFGLDSALSTPFWTAVKTGTSKDMGDNWTIGWSDKYTVGVWVGNSTGASMRQVSGVTGAGPAWHDIMRYLHQGDASRAPVTPAGLTQKDITFENNLEAARTEYFLHGTEMSRIALAASAASLRSARMVIRTPTDGTIIALDPDIPAPNQRLQLLATTPAGAAQTTVRWYADGRFLGDANPLAWYPVPGSHLIEARDDNNQTQDRVRVNIRGATARPSPPQQP